MSKKISQLAELTTVLDADILPVVNGGVTKKATKANLLKEVNASLAGKADTTHNHNDLYYLKTQIEALLTAKSDTGHIHDDRYYTETEVNNLIAGIITEVNWGDMGGTLADQGDLQATLNDKENTANKNIAGGYAGLDGAGKILSNQLPALAISDTFVVVNQTQMLALSAGIGDVAIRTDLNKSFILRGSNPALLSDWQELLSPTDAVSSVNGLTGIVNLTPGIIGAADLIHTHLKADITDFAHTHDDRYYTESEINALLTGKADTSHTHIPSDITGLTESVQDIIAGSLVEGSNISITYDDVTGEITIDSTGGGGGGSLTVGDPIAGGTAHRLLYEDGSNELAESDRVQFDGTNFSLVNSTPATSGTLAETAPFLIFKSEAYIGGTRTITTTLKTQTTSTQYAGLAFHVDIPSYASGNVFSVLPNGLDTRVTISNPNNPGSWGGLIDVSYDGAFVFRTLGGTQSGLSPAYISWIGGPSNANFASADFGYSTRINIFNGGNLNIHGNGNSLATYHRYSDSVYYSDTVDSTGSVTFNAVGSAPSFSFLDRVGINGTATTTSPLNITSLPTSAAGLATGDVWNDSGTLKIA